MTPIHRTAVVVSALMLIAATRPSLEPKDVRLIGDAALSSVTFHGSRALRVAETSPASGAPDKLVVLGGPDFQNGEITLRVSGEPSPSANAGARGFVGVMVRMAADGSAGEVFYVRPTNGRAEDQERRNHAVQYVSPPDWPWERLRRDTPSRYEAYADMEPGRWIRMRLEVRSSKARLFIGDAPQPVLIVNDLKRGPDARGPVALWVGPGAIAHFADVEITAE